MIYSNNRKLNLSGWLFNNNRSAFDSPLKLQKFVLLYELFSYIEEDESDFNNLRGWKRGPVYSSLWGDYTKERPEFVDKCNEVYREKRLEINEDRAQLSSFITSILNEKELSDLTHRLNLWHSKQDRILSGERNVNLNIHDFNDDDVKLIETLRYMYPKELIKNSINFKISDYNFVISQQDYNRLTEEHMDVLLEVAIRGGLHNPVYLDIDENGVISID